MKTAPMKTSIRPLTLLPLLALPFALSGCGGSDSDDGGDAASRFRGTYVGTFTSPQSRTGSIDLGVSADGTVDGTITGLTPTGTTASLDGTVNPNGSFAGRVTYANPASVATAAGDFSRDANGRLIGTLTLANPDGALILNIDVLPAR